MLRLFGSSVRWKSSFMVRFSSQAEGRGRKTYDTGGRNPLAFCEQARCVEIAILSSHLMIYDSRGRPERFQTFIVNGSKVLRDTCIPGPNLSPSRYILRIRSDLPKLMMRYIGSTGICR